MRDDGGVKEERGRAEEGEEGGEREREREGEQERERERDGREERVNCIELWYYDEGSLCRLLVHKKLILPTFRLDALILLY